MRETIGAQNERIDYLLEALDRFKENQKSSDEYADKLNNLFKLGIIDENEQPVKKHKHNT